MLTDWRFLAAALLSCNVMAASADTVTPPAVYIDVCVAEQDAERVTVKVSEPIMAQLKALSGKSSITSASTHGRAQFQVLFTDGATRNDRASVEEALKRVDFGKEVEVLSVLVELAQPREDGLFVGRLACLDQGRRGRGR